MKVPKSNKNWFAEWFDSDYYHILYQHRDHSEAETFIRNLSEYLALPEDTKVLDLACGKGRHSIQLNELGYNVTGLDLSKESIQFAKQFENNKLHFTNGDMRKLNFKEKFDLVFNLFTSFGYFHEETDNLKVIKSIADTLKPKGKLVLDYLNTSRVIKNLPQSESVNVGNINFQVKKELIDQFIVKNIHFEDKSEHHNYQEFVRVIDLKKFKTYFKQSGLELIETFGDYYLNSFDETNSERLILVAQKS